MNRKDVRRLKLLHVHVSPDARTVPITLRMPIWLLRAIKLDAQKRNAPYQRCIKSALLLVFRGKPRRVKCGGPGCSPYGNKNWKGPKPLSDKELYR